MQWTTVNGAPSGSTVTPTAAVSGAASSGNHVYAYTTKIQRPLRVLDAYRHVLSGTIDIPITMVALSDYALLAKKTISGKIIQACYDPNLDNGTMYLYMQPDNSDELVYFWHHRPFQDFDASTDAPDCPTEWYLPLGYTLAWILADTYGVPAEIHRRIQAKAQYFHALVEDWSIEPEGIRLEPNAQDYPNRTNPTTKY